MCLCMYACLVPLAESNTLWPLPPGYNLGYHLLTPGILCNPGIKPESYFPCTGIWNFYLYTTREAYMKQCVCCAKSFQSCLTLYDPMSHSLPDSSVHVIFLGKTTDWSELFPCPGDLPDPGIEPESLTSPAYWQAAYWEAAYWQATYSPWGHKSWTRPSD